MIAMVTIREQRTSIEVLHARFASGNIDRAEYDHRRHLADEFERIRRWAVLARTTTYPPTHSITWSARLSNGDGMVRSKKLTGTAAGLSGLTVAPPQYPVARKTHQRPPTARQTPFQMAATISMDRCPAGRDACWGCRNKTALNESLGG